MLLFIFAYVARFLLFDGKGSRHIFPLTRYLKGGYIKDLHIYEQNEGCDGLQIVVVRLDIDELQSMIGVILLVI